MATVEKSIDIRAPIEVVFDAVTDPRRGPEWNPNILDITDFSGHPLREGSTWQQTMVIMGRPTTLTCRIILYQPPHEGLLAISGGQRAHIRTRCREVEGGTRVTQTLEYEPPGGVLGKLAANLASSRLQQEIAQGLERQRAALESGAGGSGGPGTS